MKTKHTPGPWKVNLNGAVLSFNGDIIPHLMTLTRSGEITESEYEANARLIVAAPELLEALKIASKKLNALYAGRTPNDETSVIDSLIQDIESAIAKAEGRAE